MNKLENIANTERDRKAKNIAHIVGLGVAIPFYAALAYSSLKGPQGSAANFVLIGCFIAPLVSGGIYAMSCAAAYGISYGCLGRGKKKK